jgi:PTS system nitrogen regulatory IIA component
LPFRVLSLDEVVDYLHVSRADVERLVHYKEIPFEMQGDRLVFRQNEIDAWASRRILGFSEEHLRNYHKKSSAKAHDLSKQHAIVPELFKAEFIASAMTSKTKASILRDMVQLAEGTGLVNYPQELLRSMEERERMCSTALPGGMAILHPRNHEPYMFGDSFVVVGKTVQPVPFGSPDGSTTDVFFLICCQDDRIHLHVLARICMMCQQTSLLLELREAQEPAQMYELLLKSEEEVIQQLG